MQHEDVELSISYRSKCMNALSRGIDFMLSFEFYKRLRKATHCYYTGARLTTKPLGAQVLRDTDFTVDRINSDLPYIEANCVACCHKANQEKARYERAGIRFKTPREAREVLRSNSREDAAA